MRPTAHRSFALALLAAITAVDACATTDTPATTTAENAPPPRRHRRRRRRHLPPDATAAATGAPVDDAGTPPPTFGTPTTPEPATAGSIGSPVVGSAAPPETVAHYSSRNGHAHVTCEGATVRPLAVCPQCRDVPDNAAIVRAFLPAERPVLQCEPPANREGRLPMHVTFSGAGLPTDVEFPGVDVEPATAACIGRALCQMRMPTFRSPDAAVDYDFVVLVPE